MSEIHGTTKISSTPFGRRCRAALDAWGGRRGGHRGVGGGVHRRRTMVDIWGGYADEARTRPWDRDTITNTLSTTKTMTAFGRLDPACNRSGTLAHGWVSDWSSLRARVV